MRTVRRSPKPVELLFGAYRRRVLSLLLSRPDRSFYVREMARLTGTPAGSLHRELKLLTGAGLLVRSTLGNQVRYQADHGCPIYESLAAIFSKSTSPAKPGLVPSRASDHDSAAMRNPVASRRAELAPLCRRFHVRTLDLIGSAARGTFDPERSDLDFVVTFEDLPPVEFADAFFGLREGLAALFGRPVDLLTDDSIRNPYLRESIGRSRQALYAA